ncbi:hypothetical protein HPB47_023056 [Ixodes persulcatus]|uniref:Uncharacterized protein n=1 Tax=Ixodes persulcatus TaxID=34615 RepID=A0AC60Q7Z5_IXOPE|nr:hypothetical protein HPB47_023056 [Ixodes persulcatus]
MGMGMEWAWKHAKDAHRQLYFLLTLQFSSGTDLGLDPGFLDANLTGARDSINLDEIPFVNCSTTFNDKPPDGNTATVINQLHICHSGAATSSPAISLSPKRPPTPPWIFSGHGSTPRMHIVNYFLLTLQFAVMLRQQLQTARQELSRHYVVSAHLTKEVTDVGKTLASISSLVTAAREFLATITSLATLKPQAAGGGPQAEAAAAPAEAARQTAGGMTAEVVWHLQDKATLLTAQHMQRGNAIPEDLGKPEEMRAFGALGPYPGLHSAGQPGILALDVSPSDQVLTGASGSAAVFNKDTEQVVAVLKGHTQNVTSVVFHPDEDTAITASLDATVRVWHVPNAQTTQVIRAHEGPVTGLSLHATRAYLLSTSMDQHWAFSDLRTGRVLAQVGDTCALTAAEFHPDGLTLGTGTSDALVKIWDLKGRTGVANLSGHTVPITALAFSENGYYLATAAGDTAGYEVRDLFFDQSGTYLAVAGTDVRLYLCEQWDTLKVFADHTALATGVRFTHRARNVASQFVSISLQADPKVVTCSRRCAVHRLRRRTFKRSMCVATQTTVTAAGNPSPAVRDCTSRKRVPYHLVLRSFRSDDHRRRGEEGAPLLPGSSFVPPGFAQRPLFSSQKIIEG